MTGATSAAGPGLAVLASGSGTLLEAILAHGLRPAVVVSDRACRALEVAAAAGVPAVLVERTSFGPSFDRAAYTEDVVRVLKDAGVGTVAMAGFMTVLAPPAFATFPDRVLNTHPSLLPAFPGAHAVRDALAFGVKVTGCTVHLATEQVDHGPILAQEAVPVLPDDDEERLHERIKTVERRLYPLVIQEVLA
jgi:formyltetrahydrofolate-dependent phosphoribosylglycinamide formyltransferase